MFQAQEQLQADVLRYKAKIEDLEKELTLKGQVGHTSTRKKEVIEWTKHGIRCISFPRTLFILFYFFTSVKVKYLTKERI